VNIEERKLNYILQKSGIKIEEVEKRFDNIDKIMKGLKVGSKLYDCNCWGDVFEQNVVEIMDKDNGIVKLYEESINKTTVGCVADYYQSVPKFV